MTAVPPTGPPSAREEVVVRAAWALTVDPAGNLRDGAVHLRDGAIVAVGPCAEVAAAAPGMPIVGDGTGRPVVGRVPLTPPVTRPLPRLSP